MEKRSTSVLSRSFLARSVFLGVSCLEHNGDYLFKVS